MDPLSPDDATELYLRAGDVFQPATPIQNQKLFAGRIKQITKIADAANQVGLHGIVYGERGVGKTSLANMLQPVLDTIGGGKVVAKVNCDATDSFGSAWRKALDRLSVQHTSERIGFERGTEAVEGSLSDMLPEEPAPHDVVSLIEGLPRDLVAIFDEFDRLPAEESRAFTDVMKAFSDYGLSSTIIVVGVADTVDRLIAEHASIERALIQVPMPRMTEPELDEILEKAGAELGFEFSEEASGRIVRLSQGLPHYTHLLGRDTVRAAVHRGSAQAALEDVAVGASGAVEDAQQSVKVLYHDATRSGRKDALYEQVLLACALAVKDELSFFQPADVVNPMSTIMQRPYEIPAFARHLKAFCEPDRGPILERIGVERRYRYRFRNPLMEPYVIMRGLTTRLIDERAIDDFATNT